MPDSAVPVSTQCDPYNDSKQVDMMNRNGHNHRYKQQGRETYNSQTNHAHIQAII